MADKGFIDKGKDLVPTESPTFKKPIRQTLKGRINNLTVEEAMTKYVDQRSLQPKTTEKNLKKIINVKNTALNNIDLHIFDEEGVSRKTTFGKLKVFELKDPLVQEAIGNALLDQQGAFDTVSKRKNVVAIVQPFVKEVTDWMPAKTSYFKDIVSSRMNGMYNEILNTSADRSLITVFHYDHKELAQGSGRILSRLSGNKPAAHAMTLMITGGFRPSDLESLKIQEIEQAVKTGILQYETKVGGAREFRYRPVLPEHMAIFKSILADQVGTPVNDPDARVFPQGKKWTGIKKLLNTELRAEFGPTFLTVSHPHMNKVTNDPVQIYHLRHWYESRLVRIGLEDVQSRQDLMGRSSKGVDMGQQYAAITDKIGVGSKAYNLGNQANEMLAIEAADSKVQGAVLSSDWIPDSVKNEIFVDPSDSSINRVSDKSIRLLPYDKMEMTKEAYIGQTDELAKFRRYEIDQRQQILNKLVYEYNLDKDALVSGKDGTQPIHTWFKDVDAVDDVLKDIPEDQRNYASVIQRHSRFLKETAPPLTLSQVRAASDQEMKRLGFGKKEVSEGAAKVLEDARVLEKKLGGGSRTERALKLLKHLSKSPAKYTNPALMVAGGTLSSFDADAEERKAKEYYKKTGQEMPFLEEQYLDFSTFTAPVAGAVALPVKDIKDIGLRTVATGENVPSIEKAVRKSNARGRNYQRSKLRAHLDTISGRNNAFVQQPKQQPEPESNAPVSGFEDEMAQGLEAEYEGFALRSNN